MLLQGSMFGGVSLMMGNPKDYSIVKDRGTDMLYEKAVPFLTTRYSKLDLSKEKMSVSIPVLGGGIPELQGDYMSNENMNKRMNEGFLLRRSDNDEIMKHIEKIANDYVNGVVYDDVYLDQLEEEEERRTSVLFSRDIPILESEVEIKEEGNLFLKSEFNGLVINEKEIVSLFDYDSDESSDDDVKKIYSFESIDDGIVNSSFENPLVQVNVPGQVDFVNTEVINKRPVIYGENQSAQIAFENLFDSRLNMAILVPGGQRVLDNVKVDRSWKLDSCVTPLFREVYSGGPGNRLMVMDIMDHIVVYDKFSYVSYTPFFLMDLYSEKDEVVSRYVNSFVDQVMMFRYNRGRFYIFPFKNFSVFLYSRDYIIRDVGWSENDNVKFRQAFHERKAIYYKLVYRIHAGFKGRIKRKGFRDGIRISVCLEKQEGLDWHILKGDTGVIFGVLDRRFLDRMLCFYDKGWSKEETLFRYVVDFGKFKDYQVSVDLTVLQYFRG